MPGMTAMSEDASELMTEAERNAREGLAFEFLTGDFFDAGDDWLSATLLFVDCTCFRKMSSTTEWRTDVEVAVELDASTAGGALASGALVSLSAMAQAEEPRARCLLCWSRHL